MALFAGSLEAEHLNSATRILFLSSYHSEFPTSESHLEAVSSLLDQNGRKLDIVSMDTKRFPVSEQFPATYETIQRNLQKFGEYDLVLASDDNALLFLLENKNELLGDIPVFFFGINNRELAESAVQRPEFFGVIEEASLVDNAELAFELIPNLENLYLLADTSPSGRADLARLLQSIPPELSKKIWVEDLSERTFEEAALRISSYTENDAILFLSAYTDKEGNNHDFLDSVVWVKQNTNVPVFHPYTHGIGQGFLGGIVISHYDMAKLATDYAEAYLSNQTLPERGLVEEADSTYLFDYKEMVRHGIEVSQLPKDAVIRGKPISFIEKYRIYFAASFVATILMAISGLIIGVLYLRQRKLLNDLSESERQSDSLFRNSFSPILLIDPAKGDILDANPAALDYYGYSHPELTQQKLSDIDAGALCDVHKVFDTVISGNQKSFEFEHRLHSGEIRKVEVLFTCIHIDQRAVLFSIIQDTTERRQAEEQLATQKIRLANILEGTDAGTWEWNIQTDEVRFNNRWADILGYSMEELSPMSTEVWQSLCHPEDLKTAMKNLEDHFSGKNAYYSSEIRMKAKDGAWVWVSDRGRVSNWTAKGEPLQMYGIQLDISAIKQSEESLRTNLGLLTSLLDSIPDVVFFKDLDGTYMRGNAEFANFIGTPVDEIPGRTDYDFFEKSVADTFRKYDRLTLQLGKPRSNREWVTYPNGRKVLLGMLKAPYRTADGEVLGTIGVGRDITQQYEDESKLRLHALVLKQINDCVTVMDLKGKITYVNDAEIQALGSDTNRLIGTPAADYCAVNEKSLSMDDSIASAIQNGTWEGEIIKSMADGSNRQFASRLQVVHDEFGELVALCWVSTDITEQKKFETALIQAKEAAEAANEAKNQFLATMSHELRTPLNPIFGFTDLLFESDNLTDEQQSYLEIIQSRSKDLLLLIEDILNIARIEAGKFTIEAKPTLVKNILDDIASIFERPCKEKNLRMRFELGANIESPCCIDPARTRQILLNLVGNAVKFSVSGEILIFAERTSDSTNEGDSTELHFVVRDNGPGIPLEKHELVFEDFQQIDSSDSRKHEGVGLGLAICKKLVALMNGRIWIDEYYLDGAEFHVRFPAPLHQTGEANDYSNENVDQTELPAAENPDETTAQGTNAQREVLLIEDDDSNAEFMKIRLQQQDYSVTHAKNGRAALDLCRNNQFDVILMDLKLPGMSGFETTRILRKRGDNTPIVAVTALAFGKSERAELHDAGMDGAVMKPVQTNGLWDVIESAIANRG